MFEAHRLLYHSILGSKNGEEEETRLKGALRVSSAASIFFTPSGRWVSKRGVQSQKKGVQCQWGGVRSLSKGCFLSKRRRLVYHKLAGSWSMNSSRFPNDPNFNPEALNTQN